MFTWSIPADWHRWFHSDNPTIFSPEYVGILGFVRMESPEAAAFWQMDIDGPIPTAPMSPSTHLNIPVRLTKVAPFWQPVFQNSNTHLKLPCRFTQVAPFWQPVFPNTHLFLAGWNRWPHSDTPCSQILTWSYLAGWHRWPHSDHPCSQILTWSYLASWHRWPHSDHPCSQILTWSYLADWHRWPHSDNPCPFQHTLSTRWHQQSMWLPEAIKYSKRLMFICYSTFIVHKVNKTILGQSGKQAKQW